MKTSIREDIKNWLDMFQFGTFLSSLWHSVSSSNFEERDIQLIGEENA